MSGVRAIFKQNIGFTNSKLVATPPILGGELATVKSVYVRETNPIILKNIPPTSGTVVNVSQAQDVAMDNPINNSVLIYNEADDKFHVDQLSLDGGSF